MKTSSMNFSTQNQETKILIQDYLEIIWRRKWWLIVPVLISFVVGFSLYRYLPKSYISSTLILVEPQKVPSDYVKPTISGSMEERLGAIKEEILSRSLLNKIIEEFGLYQKEAKQLSREEILNLMRKKLDIKTAGSRNINAFTISFEGNDPKTVMNVTNKLASLYIEENLKIRQELIEGTTDFLEVELRRLKESLDKQEQEISDHKRKYMGSLPEQLDANLRTLDRYQSELQTIASSLKLANDRKMLLEKSISDENSTSIEALDVQTPSEQERYLNQQYAQLARMRKDLEYLRSDYTDAYPDIVTLKRKIKEVEDELSRQANTYLKEKKGSPSNSHAHVRPLNPEIQNELKSILDEIDSLKERQKSLTVKVQQLEKAVAATPLREQEMEGLIRDYEDTKRAYEALFEKKLNAKLSENLEKRQKGEQFRILDFANLPEKPSKPKALRLFGMCIAAGVGAGVGLLFLIETLDTSFKKPEEIEAELGLKVLAGIPLMKTKKKGEKQLLTDQPENRPDSVIR